MSLQTHHYSTSIPDNLFHTCLTVVDHFDTGGDIPRLYVLGSHSTITAAKHFTGHFISSLGYDETVFHVYKQRLKHMGELVPGQRSILAYAKGPSGQDLFLSIEARPNTERLRASADGFVVLDNAASRLHYALKVTIDYRTQPVSTEIYSVCLRRSDALEKSKECLSGDSDYAQFDVWEGESAPEGWLFGEDVVARAVAPSGEFYLAVLRSSSGAFCRRADYGLMEEVGKGD